MTAPVGDAGETMTVGALTQRLGRYPSDWTIVVNVSGMLLEDVVQDESLCLKQKVFSCNLDPDDVHADKGHVIFVVGSEELDQQLLK